MSKEKNEKAVHVPDDETEHMGPPLQFLSKIGSGIEKRVSHNCNQWHYSQSESAHAVFQLYKLNPQASYMHW